MLVELYKDLCKNERWYNAYCSTGEKSNGKIFFFFNTNYRKLLSFEEGYYVLKNVENVERSSWEHSSSHGQEIEKQHTVNMLKSKIFSKNANVYYRSKKGFAYSDMLAKDFSYDEKWLMTYLTILNGYFANVPNYIFERTKVILKMMEERGVSREAYTKLLKNFINTYENHSNNNIFESDYLFFDTFYQNFEGIDFLKLFLEASEEERKELKLYVAEQRKDRVATKKQIDTISYKYKSTGSYTRATLIDNAKIQYFTLLIMDGTYSDYQEFYQSVTEKFRQLYPSINVHEILSFIENHKSVYELIFNELFGNVQYSLNFGRKEDETVSDQSVDLDQRIDDTEAEAVNTYHKVSTVLKNLAKANSNYKCELEDFFDCQYFTSKESHKHYVEVHHLIPRAVGNDFESSIEVVENYVTLCPKCHRLVHLGEDVERKPALHYLYLKRHEKLKERGLDITEKQLKKYYLIEE
ncbi:MAG: HNH endonuclease [Clostridia bacterium]|nr:HNH endonuclease [Clostridia bacterium]